MGHNKGESAVQHWERNHKGDDEHYFIQEKGIIKEIKKSRYAFTVLTQRTLTTDIII